MRAVAINSLEEILGENAYSAENVEGPEASEAAPKSLVGFEPFPPRGSQVSNDLIDQIREEDID